VDFTEDGLAVFKFSLIAPLVNGSYPGPANRHFEEASAKFCDVPGIGERNFFPVHPQELACPLPQARASRTLP
jgi:hypothetical protein